MATVDPTNVLFKIAHPDLYERNPFNLLNLPINASAKDIRRRKEDIEAAFEAGTEAEEFKHVLPLDASRKPPTLDAVHDAFAELNDPELRIAYSLFWFWPEEGSGSKPSHNSMPTDIESLSATWREKSMFLPAGAERATSRHNLAVCNHSLALFGEQGLVDIKSGIYPKVGLAQIREYWENSINLWNVSAKDADVWRIVAELVSSLNDPRLDYRFARSLRDQFAFAFDQINVELAIAFARVGQDTDAKRQVEYMKLSQPDADDVEGTFDDAFAGLQRQVEAIVNAAREEADNNPKTGLVKVDEILERTQEPIQISRVIFEKGESIREAIITTIFAGVRNCMIAYGNETKDWDGCLKRIVALKALSENDNQVELVAEDERIIAKNKRANDEVNLCWFCKVNKKSSTAEIVVPMNGILIKEGKAWFHTVDIIIPRCDECKSKTAIRDFCLKNTWIFVVFLLPVVMGISYSVSGENDPLIAVMGKSGNWWECFINGFVSGAVVFVGIVVFISFLTKFIIIPNPNFLSKWLYRKFGPNYQEYPPYKAWKEKGFKEGKKP